ncbi:DUF2975 domain-containing protein [Falsiroseomonas selenitidurans]|uniref:DUF2975 domain-containing protein n=1 Tax=Falsiroseomonas selenitidurans TaxID=2716335 RepID=A0ABX1E550_9PROT|nr:DUF2975 domain-containing protein [Falsiroseomonas selenitidurans]NKC32300.1 DUF2975 domain-containing protein [Falsiroseomonas selenitidurans]
MTTHRLGLSLRAATLAVIALLLLIPLLGVAAPGSLPAGLAFRQLAATPARLPAALALALPYLAAALAFAQLHRFATRLHGMAVFSLAAAEALRRFGGWLLLAALLLPASRLAALGPAGLIAPAPLLGCAVGLAIGLVFLSFAAVLREATRATEENAAII